MRGWLTLVAIAIWSAIAVSFAGETGAPLISDKRWEQARKDLAQGKAAEAKAIVEALLKRFPGDADLYLFLGMTDLRLRDPQAAVVAINKAIEIDPNHVEARTLLGYIELEVHGDVDAALQQYRKVIELSADSPEAYSNLAVALKKKREFEQAIASLNQALKLKPDYAGAFTTRGAIFAEQNKWREAKQDFERALKLNPRDEGALYGLAQALREAKDYGGAQGALSELISRSGNFVYWLEWVRVVMIRYWWALLLFAIGWALKGRFMKARTAANG